VNNPADPLATDELMVERRGRVLELTINRPERRNALSPRLVGALSGVLTTAAADPEVYAVLLTAPRHRRGERRRGRGGV